MRILSLEVLGLLLQTTQKVDRHISAISLKKEELFALLFGDREGGRSSDRFTLKHQIVVSIGIQGHHHFVFSGG